MPPSTSQSTAPARTRNWRHILILRTDHLGDMLLTLPMATAIKSALPACRVTVLASTANAAAARHHPHVDHVEVDPQESKGSNLRGVTALAERLRHLACDAAVVVHPTPRLAVAAFLARIPLRVGTAYRAYSVLFNRRVRQHRRRSDQHEADLNLELLHPLGIRSPTPARGLWVHQDDDVRAVTDLLNQHSLQRGELVVLHPGSAGSTMNWAPSQYVALGRLLQAEGLRVVITGGPSEVALTTAIAQDIGSGAVSLGGKLSLGELAELIGTAAAYVGSPTGPTHLSAILGTTVVALYPPLRSTMPQRWRPLGDRVTILQPAVGQVCPTCVRERCPFFHCMERHLDPVTVADTVLALARPRDGKRHPR